MALPTIETPTFELKIPGRKDSITFRPFLVKEDKLLTLAAESGEIEDMVGACVQVVNNCAMGSLDAKDLAMYQLQWLFLELRKRSIGGIQNFTLTCGGCKEKVAYEMDVGEFKVMGDTSSDTKVIKLNKDLSFTLKYPSCSLQGQLPNMSDEEVIKTCMTSIVNGDETINPRDETADSLEEFIENLPIHVIKEAEEFFAEMPFLGHEITYKCKKCEKENFILINGYEHFFG